jgi:hypothetical protein
MDAAARVRRALRDVERDGVGGEPGHDVGLHRSLRIRVRDLPANDVCDVLLRETLVFVGGERVVEVGADRALRLRVGERVAGTALLDEERLALARVARGDATDGAAAGRDERDEENRGQCERLQQAEVT